MSRAWILVAGCLTAACVGEDVGFSQVFLAPAPHPERPTPGATPDRERPTWTILVYGHGDHDLSNALLSDLAEMARAHIPPEVQLLVFADWDASRTIAGGSDPFPGGAIWYRVRGQGQELERIEHREELDFDDPAVLAAAVGQAFTDFPADRHGLVLWDHGGAWSVGFGGDSQDGTRRQSPGLPVDKVATAVAAGLRQAGLTGTRPLDFFSFDACLMGGAETITAFQHLAEVFLADAELDYGDGWDYTATLDWIGENLAAGARELAAFEVSAWDAHHRTASLNDALLRSHVAIDNARWPAFVAATRDLVGAAGRPLAPETVASALQHSLPAYRSQVTSPGGSHLRDLGDLLDSVAAASDRDLAAAAAAAASAGRAARIAVSGGSLREGQLGVHVFAGPPLALPAADVERYPRLARPWAAGSGWGELLQQLRTLADGEGPGIVGIRGSATATFDLIGGDVARVEVILLQQQPGPALRPAIARGTLASAFVRAGRYDFSWGGRVWQLASDTVTADVTLEPWIWQVRDGTLEAPVLAVRGIVRASSGEALDSALLVDAGTLEATAFLVASPASPDRPAVHDLSTLREADPGAAFLPVLGTVDLRSGAASALPPGAAVPLGGGSGKLALRQSDPDPGEYLLLVRSADVWGNETRTLFPLAVP